MVSKQANKREVLAAPRGHGKSVLMGLVFPLWAICTRRKRFIVLISSSSTIAEGFLASITRELEENALIKRDFGELTGRRKWTNSDLLTSTGIRVSARGVGSSLRGMRSFQDRPDLIICDDLEDDESVLNPQNREKLMNWFFSSVLNLLGPSGDVFVVGTVLHHDSLLSLLLKAWQGRRYQALSPEGEALWPDYYSAERLLKIKHGDGEKEGIGTLAFEGEYQNNPISPEEQLFRSEWIRCYQPEEMNGEFLVVTALDPALGGGRQGQKRLGDYSALVTVGQQAGKIYVLEAELLRLSPKETLEAAVSSFRRWSVFSHSASQLRAGQPQGCKHNQIYSERIEIASPTSSCPGMTPTGKYKISLHFLCLAIEVNTFQAVLKDVLEEISRKEGLFIPIRPVKNFSDKVARVSSLSPLVESGSILFRQDQKDLIEQLIQFPRGAHDDGPDALEMAVRMLRRYGTPRVRFM